MFHGFGEETKVEPVANKVSNVNRLGDQAKTVWFPVDFDRDRQPLHPDGEWGITMVRMESVERSLRLSQQPVAKQE